MIELHPRLGRGGTWVDLYPWRWRLDWKLGLGQRLDEGIMRQGVFPSRLTVYNGSHAMNAAPHVVALPLRPLWHWYPDGGEQGQEETLNPTVPRSPRRVIGLRITVWSRAPKPHYTHCIHADLLAYMQTTAHHKTLYTGLL